MSNIVEFDHGKSRIGFEEALFIQEVKRRAQDGIITVRKAIEAFWAASGTLLAELIEDGLDVVAQVEEEIATVWLFTFSHLFRRAGVALSV